MFIDIVMFAIVDSSYNNPFIISSKYIINELLQELALENVAATILNLLGYEKPERYLDSVTPFFK